MKTKLRKFYFLMSIEFRKLPSLDLDIPEFHMHISFFKIRISKVISKINRFIDIYVLWL